MQQQAEGCKRGVNALSCIAVLLQSDTPLLQSGAASIVRYYCAPV